MGRYTGKTCRLLSFLSLTASFFVVEIVVGYLTNSLALVGDSFHMLSDVVALVVGYASVRISKWHTKKNTFGWARAEVLGALVNTVFLIALCFSIFVEAIKRMIVTEPIEDAMLMLIVGGLGLFINVIGLFLFHGHGHSHGGGGGHGHSHGGGGHGHSHGNGNGDHGHSHNNKKDHDQSEDEAPSVFVTTAHNNHSGAAESNPEQQQLCNGTSKHETAHTKSDDEEEDDDDNDTKVQISSSAQLNMRGVFLHVLGDAFGSVIVIISAIVIHFVEADWKYKIDPILSMVMVLIILSTTIPLLRESALILLQTVPTHIQVKEIQDKLIRKVKGVLAVHEFHVWQLAGNRIIASAHIRCQNLHEYMRIAEAVKNFFHNEGIHSTTIQPEFAESTSREDLNRCLLDCNDGCQPALCCTKDHRKRQSVVQVSVNGGEICGSNASLFNQLRNKVSKVFHKNETDIGLPASEKLLAANKSAEQESNV